jgi:hypothetical protein
VNSSLGTASGTALLMQQPRKHAEEAAGASGSIAAGCEPSRGAVCGVTNRAECRVLCCVVHVKFQNAGRKIVS